MDGKPQADSQSSGFRSDAPLLRLEGPNLMADAASSLELTSSLPAMPEEQMVAAVSARESPASAPASANAPALSLQTDLEASHDHNVVLSFRSLGPIHIETTKEENEVPALSQEAQQHREGSNNSSEQEDGDGNPSSAEQHERNALVFWKACLTCLGIVYGDIGTSPIYTVSSCVSDLVNTRGEIAEADILGIISLLFWALVLVPTCKYCVWVLKATYHGEGGTFSLMGLLSQPKVREKYPKWMYNLLLPGSLCAIALLIGDAAITPAISVVSAIEGIGVYAPSITRDEIVGISIAILGLLYLGQKAGVTRIGACFGPFVLIWFVTIGSLGVYYISYAPGIFKAVSPHYAVDYFVRNGRQSYSILGLVVLSITGVEALYADLGQFGAPAVRWTWICLCLPCLLLQYFGQGAVILSNLSDTDSAQNIFFSAVPRSLLWPVFTITTIATIIASQATISGVQVVIMQAIHLNCFPRLHVIHQSKQYHSRIYIPLVNYLLMAATLSLTAAFRSSANLTLMYGLTISLIMLATTLATAMVMLYVWAWNRWLVAAWALCFTFVDTLFVGATIEKIATGGWLPVSFAFTAGALLLSYNYGFVEANKAEASVAELYLGNPLANRDNLPEDATISEQFKELCVALTSLIAIRDSKVAVLQRERPGEPKNLSVFLTSNLSRVPLSLVHLVNTLNIFPSRVLILNVQFVTKPFAQDNRLSFIAASSVGGPDWLYGAVIRVGFAETKQLDIARFVDQIVIPSIVLEETITQYFVTDREFDIDKNNHPIRKFALAAFTFLQLNATRISRFFHLPTDRTLEIGVRVPL